MKTALIGAASLIAALAAWPQPAALTASMRGAGAAIELSPDLAPLATAARALAATESVAAETSSPAPEPAPPRPLFKDRATLDRELAAGLARDHGEADER